MVCQPPRNLIQPRMGGCMNRRLAWPGSWGDWDGDILPKYPPGSHGMVVMVMLHQISDFLLFMLPTPGSRGLSKTVPELGLKLKFPLCSWAARPRSRTLLVENVQVRVRFRQPQMPSG